MKRLKGIITTFTLSAASFATATGVLAQDLETFGVLAGSTITNTGPTTISGNVGLSPGTAVTGFGSVTLNDGTIYVADGVSLEAQSQLTTLYNVLESRPTTVDRTGTVLGAGESISPGVYNFDTSAQVNGELTLDAGGDPDAVFIFNIGSTLTTASGSEIKLKNGAQAGNVYFRVGSSATLGTGSTLVGQIVALTSISLNTNAVIDCGAALARNGAVTLDSNVIGICVIEMVPIKDILGDDTDDTATEVAETFDDYVADGGTLPPGFLALGLLTPAELALALDQIAGETATGVAPTGIQAMDSFLDMVTDLGLGDGLASMGPGGLADSSAPGKGTVKVLGYAAASDMGNPALAAVNQAASDEPLPPPRNWDMWIAGFGGQNDVDGDSSAGTHNRSSDNYGLAGGITFRVSPNTKLGLAVSGGRTSFSLSDGFGRGSSDVIQAAIYGRTDFKAAYISGALAYGYHDQTTNRTITVAGDDRFTAAFKAHDIAGQLEAGYTIGWLTPYAGVRVQSFQTPAYSEKTASGASTFALAYEKNTTTSTRTELGARFAHNISLPEYAVLTLRSRVAWAHDFSSGSSMDAAFQALPGSTFTVNGASAAADSVLISVGAEVLFNRGLKLAGSFDTAFADNAQTYAGSARLVYTW